MQDPYDVLANLREVHRVFLAAKKPALAASCREWIGELEDEIKADRLSERRARSITTIEKDIH